jgi:CDP-6-deoxy-D-xylo-4-hexulose-3-dehydrase
MSRKILYGECTFGKPEIKAVNRVLKNGWLSGGVETAAFEKELAEWFGVKYAIATNSGSCSNFISVQALGLPAGSEVITTAVAFPTTVSPMYYHNLVPVYVDVESYLSLVIDLNEVEEAITEKTKAIMFAHTLGNVCDMERLMYLVKKYKLKLVEDCCDAVGSKFDGKKVGTFGDLATVSFYPSHHLTTGGEGGAILTNDPGLNRTCRSIRDWGRACFCAFDEKNPLGACGHRFSNPPFDHRYFYTSLGLNMKMTEIQAAFGREQIKRLDGFISKRKSNFDYLYGKLRFGNPGMNLVIPDWGNKWKPRPLPYLKGGSKLSSKPDDKDYRNPDRYKKNDVDISWFAFPLTFYNLDRGNLVKYLEENGIQVRTLFAGNLTEHPAYKLRKHRIASKLENTDIVLKNTIFVGIGPKITHKDMDYVAEKLISYFKECRKFYPYPYIDTYDP